MQKNGKRNARRKGFTLIELLIVIVIIGIMSSMMMIATGSATDKAEATRIVSDLRTMQSASVLYFADNNHWPKTTDVTNLKDYLSANLDSSKYSLVTSDDALSAQYENENLPKGVASKLLEMAEKGAPITVDGGKNIVQLVIRNK